MAKCFKWIYWRFCCILCLPPKPRRAMVKPRGRARTLSQPASALSKTSNSSRRSFRAPKSAPIKRRALSVRSNVNRSEPLMKPGNLRRSEDNLALVSSVNKPCLDVTAPSPCPTPCPSPPGSAVTPSTSAGTLTKNLDLSEEPKGQQYLGVRQLQRSSSLRSSIRSTKSEKKELSLHIPSPRVSKHSMNYT